ncbi:EamA family transporter [Paenibacillus sp. 1P07SE]|uniref:EamA family transporter n=1 Tax=Paenibacillus sp. 1P07SE TaxID=3132209 RepID=UPI0039A5D505
MTYLMLLLNILLLVAGQYVWKLGLTQAGGLGWHNLPQVALSPLILLGIGCYGLATLLWLAVLSRLPLSSAYPLQSLAYVIGLFVAWQLLGEAIPANRWFGTGLILAGVLVVSWK